MHPSLEEMFKVSRFEIASGRATAEGTVDACSGRFRARSQSPLLFIDNPSAHKTPAVMEAFEQQNIVPV